MFYRIYPEAAANAPWIEVALHVEVAEPMEAGDVRRRHCEDRLRRAGDALVHRLQGKAAFQLDMTAPYYSLHPPLHGEGKSARISLTVSLVFSALGQLESEFRKAVWGELDRLVTRGSSGVRFCLSRSTRRRTRSSVRGLRGPVSVY